MEFGYFQYMGNEGKNMRLTVSRNPTSQHVDPLSLPRGGPRLEIRRIDQRVLG